MLFWDDITIFWDEKLLLFTFLTGKLRKKLVLDQNGVCLPKYHNKLSSQNNVRKYRPENMKRIKDS